MLLSAKCFTGSYKQKFTQQDELFLVKGNIKTDQCEKLTIYFDSLCINSNLFKLIIKLMDENNSKILRDFNMAHSLNPFSPSKETIITIAKIIIAYVYSGKKLKKNTFCSGLVNVLVENIRYKLNRACTTYVLCINDASFSKRALYNVAFLNSRQKLILQLKIPSILIDRIRQNFHTSDVMLKLVKLPTMLQNLVFFYSQKEDVAYYNACHGTLLRKVFQSFEENAMTVTSKIRLIQLVLKEIRKLFDRGSLRRFIVRKQLASQQSDLISTENCRTWCNKLIPFELLKVKCNKTNQVNSRAIENRVPFIEEEIGAK